MNKKFTITLCILLGIMLCLGILVLYFYNQDFYSQFNKISFTKILTQNPDDYYVYFYRKDCVFCIGLEDNVEKFASINTTYFVDMAQEKNKDGFYDAGKFHTENDIEIGKVNSEGKIEYYNGESEEKYTNGIIDEKGNLIEYEILTADENYLKVNSHARNGYVYAKNCSPQIDISIEKISDFKIIGTPTMIHVINGKIDRVWDGEVASILKEEDSNANE